MAGDTERLRERIAALRRVAGADAAARWDELARLGDTVTLAAELMERHYDPRYARSRERHEGRRAATVSAPRLDEAGLEDLAGQIEAWLAQAPECAPAG